MPHMGLWCGNALRVSVWAGILYLPVLVGEFWAAIGSPHRYAPSRDLSV